MPVLSIGLGVVTAPFTGGLSLASTAVGAFGKVLKMGWGLLTKLWRKVKFWSLAATAALAGTIYMAAKFQSQMAFVATMVKDTGKWMGKFTQEVKNMSVEFGQATKGMTQALYDILSASVPPQKAIKVLAVASKAAVAGFTEVTRVGKTLTSIMNGMGIAFDQADRVADVLFRTVEKGQMTFDQLQGNLARAMVAARSARVPFEELAASYAFLTRAGFNVAMAETSIARALTAILTPREQARKAAEKYGIELGEVTLANKGLLGVIKDLQKAGLTEAQLQELFPAVRARRAISAMIKDVKSFEGDVTAMYKSGGAQARAFAKASDTLSFQFKKFLQSVKILLIDLVLPALPALQKLFKRLTMIGKYLRETIAVDMAKDIAGFADKVTKFIENIIFWLLQEIPYIVGKISLWFQKIYKQIRVILDIGVFKWFFSTLWTAISNWYENLWNVTTGLAKNLAKRIYETARWTWWQIKGFITGEAIPEFVTEFTDLFEGIELQWKSRMPEAFKEGFRRVAEWHQKHSDKLNKQYEERRKKLKDLRDKMDAEDLKAKDAHAESASKIDHAFEKEKMNQEKKTVKAIIEEERKKLNHLKALGQLSLEEELSRLKKLLAMSKANTEERMKLEKDVYALEKELRNRRKQEAFEHFGMMELKEREQLQAKITYLEKFLKEEKGSYQERREAAIELFKLRQELRKSDVEEQKKLNEFYMDESWKRLKAQEEILKKRKFMLAKDAFARRKINAALEKNQRMQAQRRWEFISKLRVKDKKGWDLEGLRRLRIAERHITESLKKDKLSKREKERGEQELNKVRGQIGKAREAVMKKEGINAKELLEKEKQWHKELEKEIAKATGKRIVDQETKEKEAQQKRIDRAKELKEKVDTLGKEAKEKVKDLSISMYNSLTSTIKVIVNQLMNLEKELVRVLEKMRQLCEAAKCVGGPPTPGAGRDVGVLKFARGGGTGRRAVGNGVINVGPIYIEKMDSMVDAIRAGEKIGEELASSSGRDFRIVL